MEPPEAKRQQLLAAPMSLPGYSGDSPCPFLFFLHPKGHGHVLQVP